MLVKFCQEWEKISRLVVAFRLEISRNDQRSVLLRGGQGIAVIDHVLELRQMIAVRAQLNLAVFALSIASVSAAYSAIECSVMIKFVHVFLLVFGISA
jgi:uncharacterized protein (UPF0216 family)